MGEESPKGKAFETTTDVEGRLKLTIVPPVGRTALEGVSRKVPASLAPLIQVERDGHPVADVIFVPETELDVHQGLVLRALLDQTGQLYELDRDDLSQAHNQAAA
ncbi:MAG: hypothetical protein R3313_03870 [Candidatus Saccharimonadales bacterium]|nr:hypothetical protein [Candidatus Saccharimonadales bacterium]